MADHELVAAFAGAKHFLACNQRDTRSRLICEAINEACAHGLIEDAVAKRAKALIHERIEHLGSVTLWLRHKGYIPAHHHMLDAKWDEVRAYRHRWLTALIKEFS